MTHHSAIPSSLRIKNFKIEKFGDFSSDIDFETKMEIFSDEISLIINQCHLQATEGRLLRTLSLLQPRCASKRMYIYILAIKTRLMFLYIYYMYVSIYISVTK